MTDIGAGSAVIKRDTLYSIPHSNVLMRTLQFPTATMSLSVCLNATQIITNDITSEHEKRWRMVIPSEVKVIINR